MPETKENEGGSKVRQGSLGGIVMGYSGDRLTRPIFPANVFLLVHITGKDGKTELYYPAPDDKLGKLRKKHDIRGIGALEEKHPAVYPHINRAVESFRPFRIDEGNGLGRFKFKDIPAGSWGYVAAAYVEDEVYMHTDRMGDNGMGKNEAIYGKDIIAQDGNALENVVIPVKDVWLEKVKPAKKVKVNETDKDMDQPSHLRKMLVKDI
ncbi:hypothetical protein JW898_00500 [Candidatus Woesearchaeota archaeon]|nr:hypothetical protein [Candidatus Woesearchaeota archaeon]